MTKLSVFNRTPDQSASATCKKCIFRSALLLLLAFLLLATVLPAADPPPRTRRPKIGLVLEGGGALGFAHVGVLRWLEANRIPISYVAGTSMGGLVGGMYAAGKSPAEISSLVDDIDWADIMSGVVPFPALSFRRKQDRLAYPNRFELGLRGGVRLPEGLNSGYAVDLVIDRAFAPYYNLRSFDDLPIPFRCVATEMKTGTQKVFDKGILQHALRATMSIPGLFSPLEMDGALYVDGAAVNNLPVDVAKGMGADVTIAVYLDTGTADPKTFNSWLGVAGRNLAIMVAVNEQASLKAADVLISAPLRKYTALDFGSGAAIAEIGYQAAESNAAKLQPFIVSEAEWNAYVEERNRRKRVEVPKIDYIAVEGNSVLSRANIEKGFADQAGAELNLDDLEAKIQMLQGSQIFGTINYRLEENDGKTGLLVRPREKSYGPPFINLGIAIEGSDPNDIRLGIAARLTQIGIAGPGSELRTDFAFGATAGVTTELFRPLTSTSNFFVAPRASATRSLFDVYSRDTQVAEYILRNYSAGVDFGYLFSNKAQIRVGQGVTRLSIQNRIGQELDEDFRIMTGVTSARFDYYNQDDALLPTDGSIIQAFFNRYSERPNGEGGFQQAEVRASKFVPVNARGSVFATASFGTSFGQSGLGVAGFGLGGPLRLSAYGRNELLGNRYGLFQAGYMHRVLRLNPLLGDALYVIGFYEAGKVRSIMDLPDLPQDVSAAVVVKTLIGPIFTGISFGDGNHRKWYFGIGRIF
jgi:NTE family protein